MLVRKLKCPNCGGNKVNEITTGFIYCDYCASFMGYDFEKMTEESANIFDMDYFQKHGQWPPEVQSYLEITQKLGEIIASQDKEKLVDAMVKLEESQVSLFPNRYSPKMKNSDYRKKHLNFMRAFWTEKVEDDYFEEQKQIQEKMGALTQNLSIHYENNKVIYEYDDNLVKYFEEVSTFCKESAEKTMKYESVNLFPEPVNSSYADMVYKQTINAYTKLLDEEGFKKIAEQLGLKTEYIEIPQIDSTEINCICCNNKLSILEGTEKILCEACGTTNNVKTKEIICENCAGHYTPEESIEKSKCPYCGSRIIIN